MRARAPGRSATGTAASGTAASGDTHGRILDVVRAIPRGKVATYGQVATLAGLPGNARLVGYALHALPDGSRVPWQRVLNAKGEVSPRAIPGADGFQRALLEREGVPFDDRGRVDLAACRWKGGRSTAVTRSGAPRSGRAASRGAPGARTR